MGAQPEKHTTELGQRIQGTLVMEVEPVKPQMEKIEIAARVIQKGGIVAFPTETVYGLGADALNAVAVEKLFEVKRRPPDNPIIVHISSEKEVFKLAEDVPACAEKLMKSFWPGPLTVVLKRARVVPEITVVGLETIAIRMPKNKVALALIETSGTPIAAPSANLAGKPSPTTAQHVIEDLAGRIDIILNAGPTPIGVESTVVDLTSNPPAVLRPGGTPYERLKAIVGEIDLHPIVTAESIVTLGRAISPGMKHRHYAPEAELMLVEGEPERVFKKVQELAQAFSVKGKKVGILATDESIFTYRADVVKSLGSREDFRTMAKRLFSLLRQFDKENVDVIIAEGTQLQGLGLAVMNRLRKASGYNIIKT